ncbi:MAG: polyprenyl synthetase family protein [Parachlamydia sp.]|jgi:geranylgeranyl diphosphate synthase type II|nr:polyprenyl synthetase family protein [Parachlamydia sp.]
MPVTRPSFAPILESYRLHVESLIKNNLSSFGPGNELKEACAYALLNGGKRFRSALVLMIAKALGQEADASLAALSIEYFHTASLIADDLPCMDNDDFRRSKPALHISYGESVALLASYALISAGYGAIARNAMILANPSICPLAIENAAHNTGIYGAAMGQYLDLHGEKENLAALQEAMHLKTVALFEISFVFGWLFGGGDPSRLPAVKKCAAHFGMAFQIADDLGDRKQDLAKGSLNLANALGEEKAKEIFFHEWQSFDRSLADLSLLSDEFAALSGWLNSQI